MKTKHLIAAGALACTLFQSALAQDFQDSSLANIKRLESQAYHQMESRYAVFASLFNLCQQNPDSSRCEDEYDKRQSQYKQAKSNYDVFHLLTKEDMLTTQLPAGAEQDLRDNLVELGYLDQAAGDDSQELLDAINRWCESNGIEAAPEPYLLHLVMTQTDLAQQPRG